MPKQFNQNKKFQKETLDKRSYKIMTTIDQSPYLDEGCNCDKNGLYGDDSRRFKSWKNYRKHQWKSKL